MIYYMTTRMRKARTRENIKSVGEKYEHSPVLSCHKTKLS